MTGVQQRTRKFVKIVGSKGGPPYADASRVLVAPVVLVAPASSPPIPNTLMVMPKGVVPGMTETGALQSSTKRPRFSPVLSSGAARVKVSK